MKTPYFLLLMLLCAWNLIAQEGDQLRLARIGCPSSKEFIFQIPEAKLEGLPKWHPDGDKPLPVSLKRATELGRAALKIRHPSIQEFETSSVILREIVATKRYGAWFYEIDYLGKRDGKPIGSCGLFAVILMDGTSVEPVVTEGGKE
jgi:hypothetical protein